MTLLWDVYQLRGGVRDLVAGGTEGATQLRDIAAQLELALDDMKDGELRLGDIEDQEEASAVKLNAEQRGEEVGGDMLGAEHTYTVTKVVVDVSLETRAEDEIHIEKN